MLHIIWDVETTGLLLHPLAKDALQPRIIEFAALLVDAAGAELEEHSVMIDPGCAIPERITKITGITDDDVKGKPTFKDAYAEIVKLFAKADVMVSHNLSFDSGMLRLELERIGALESFPWPERSLCTVQEHAEEYGRRPKLTELYEAYIGKPLAQTHRAIDDVRALKELCMAAEVLR
jgi:DNA polymerase III epsilon subunit-like protein